MILEYVPWDLGEQSSSCGSTQQPKLSAKTSAEQTTQLTCRVLRCTLQQPTKKNRQTHEKKIHAERKEINNA
jgi:hypothetical protein